MDPEKKHRFLYIFQFQYGSIERLAMAGISAGASAFQFQYGSIESLETLVNQQLRLYFNSSMVRLRAKENNAEEPW